MTDRITTEHRSWNMSRITGKNTKPEKAVRSMLHRLGLRFRLHQKDLPGCPDIVLARHCTVVFVHGCFWHRHAGCQFAYTPKSRTEFWKEKFERNVARDLKVKRMLLSEGWRVVIVWECELRNPDRLTTRMGRHFKSRTI